MEFRVEASARSLPERLPSSRLNLFLFSVIFIVSCARFLFRTGFLFCPKILINKVVSVLAFWGWV